MLSICLFVCLFVFPWLLISCFRVVNETYDAETETRRSKQRLETFGRYIQAVTSH